MEMWEMWEMREKREEATRLLGVLIGSKADRVPSVVASVRCGGLGMIPSASVLGAGFDIVSRWSSHRWN